MDGVKCVFNVQEKLLYLEHSSIWISNQTVSSDWVLLNVNYVKRAFIEYVQFNFQILSLWAQKYFFHNIKIVGEFLVNTDVYFSAFLA